MRTYAKYKAEISHVYTRYRCKDERINVVGKGKDQIITDSETEEKDGVLIVHPISVTRNQVYIVCPYCHKIHVHGRNKKAIGEEYGYRRPHCSPTIDKPDYYIGKVIDPI
jgi:hypothetical protein